MNKHKYTNSLISETSPYLLQHAHNPVNWMPWGNEALEKAKSENKLLIISIGYSACHWCHVMEHETFEDPESALVMNRNFVSIKVDREERPDIDHIYMNAVQILTGRGGWPLNCIALPDGRPIWAGTYLTRENWVETISSISRFYSENRIQTEEYAEKLLEGINQQAQLTNINSNSNEKPANIESVLKIWKKRFDTTNGGTNGAPKFMLPNNWLFLLRAGITLNKTEILDQVYQTLEKMAFGGIYDQIGGGFARYSTDEIWKVPHFEKMLYDNAQLIQLYSEAYKTNKNALYKQVVAETFGFIKRELFSPENGFFSALDADSEGVEGKFYIWEKHELKSIIGDEFELFSRYFNINETGYWEENNFILLRTISDSDFSYKNNIDNKLLVEKVKVWKELLLETRNKRIWPGLDDKILCSWNAMTITGLLSAYTAFGEEEYLEFSLKNAVFIQENMIDSEGRIYHTYKNKTAKIPGFLEDYAFTIESFISLFETTAEKKWLDLAVKLSEIVFEDFFDPEKSIFYFTDKNRTGLITRTYELNDNVIPSSNSVMARNLFRLSVILGNTEFYDISKKMLNLVAVNFENYPSGYSNWLQLLLDLSEKHYEIAIVGKNASEFLKQFQSHYLPRVTFCASKIDSEIALLKNRYIENKTLIYVCSNNTCMLPVDTVNEALKLLNKPEN